MWSSFSTMASLLLVSVRRVGGAAVAAATAAEAAVTGGQDVSYLYLCRRHSKRRSIPFARQIRPFLPERLRRQPQANYQISTSFPECLVVRTRNVYSDKKEAVQPTEKGRGLREQVCSTQNSPSSADVYPASQFASSSSAAAAASFLFFTSALHPAAHAAGSDTLTLTFGAACKIPPAGRGSSAAALLRVAASCGSCVPHSLCVTSFRVFPAPSHFLFPHGNTARAAYSTSGNHATSSGRSSNASRASGGDSADYGNTSGSSGHVNNTHSENSKNNKISKSTTWLEVERMRPRAPNPWDGTYQWPAAAPDPLEIKRESFHAFMHGKQEMFSRELKVFVYGWAMAGLLVGLTALTIYVMAPDDFEWVEEERARMERAKRKKAAADSSSFSLPAIDNIGEVPGDASKPSTQRKEED